MATTLAIKGRPFFCSWSGGKDSCLALYHAIREGGVPKSLMTMMVEDGETSRSHGLTRTLLEEQARRLGIPIVFCPATWDSYEAVFVETLHELKKNGVQVGVFGDIDVDRNREWVHRVCKLVGVAPFQPLWLRPRRELLEEFIDLGFTATVVVTKDDQLDSRFLGRVIDRETLSLMEEAGIDPSGEMGEYHTVVSGGPIFGSEIVLEHGASQSGRGYSFLSVSPSDSED